jgi:hypothetical protein
MVQPVATVVSWGGDLSDGEIERLKHAVDAELTEDSLHAISSAYQAYIFAHALNAHALPSKLLQQRLNAVRRQSRALAELLGADWSYFDEFFSHRKPRNGLPRDKNAEEINARIELELVHLDIAFRKKHGVDPRFEDIDLLTVAWQLSQVSRAAENSLELLRKQQRKGRPDTGAGKLIERVIEALQRSEISVTCWYSDIEGGYQGTFVEVVRWLRGLDQPIAEAESTLCKMAVGTLSRRDSGR